MKNRNNWLIEYSKNITSQEGEDGIIAKILEFLPDKNNWCVEFGAWDGKAYSNTANLILNKNFSSVLIEGDEKRFKDLVENYKSNGSVIPLNQFVGFETENNLDSVLSKTPIPIDFDFLSIDIDGNEYHVLEQMSTYIPKFICVEYNPTIPNEVEFVQKKDMTVNHGNSIKSLTILANKMGYELLVVTRINAFYVRNKYFNLFNINDNSVGEMRKDFKYITHLFSGYDGTVFTNGYQGLPWHNIPVKSDDFQILPKFLRKFPDQYNKFSKFLMRLFIIYRKLT